MKLFLKIALYVVLIAVALGMIFPMAWMLILSTRENPEQFTNFFDIITSNTTFQNYTDALSSDAFDIYFLNSVVVASAVTAGNVVFCLMCGYAFARKNFGGKEILFASILGTLMIPPQVIMIPLYRLMVEFGWINTYAALIVPWMVTPFGIFLVRQYIAGLPAEIEDAARLDGASEWYILFKIVMPLSKPILVVLAIYAFLGNWNSFLFPFLFTNDETMRTLPVGLAFYLGKQSIDWGHLMAGAGISAIPILILFIAFQKQIIEGLTAGAVKE
jgi:multiple sugar transport system permease protein